MMVVEFPFLLYDESTLGKIDVSRNRVKPF